MLAASLATLALVYAAGVIRLWRHAGYGRGIRLFDLLAFSSGWLALVVALSPPLDELSDKWLVAHMIQHELLMVIAAPLIAISLPLVAVLWAMPSDLRQTVVDAVRNRQVRNDVRKLSSERRELGESARN